MATTTTKDETLQEVLEKSDLNTLADALRQVGGKHFGVVKVTFAALADVAVQDITTAAAKAAATIVGIDLESGENLPAIGQIISLRSTAGSMAVHGAHVMADAGGTALVPGAAAAGVALLSDDGKTITFQAGVTAFVLQYVPRSATPLTNKFAPSV